ncbi:TetR/AcrR family transcriptional regulator [Ammonicoccus fulvus]|uniref:TetR/AcrR family transcriptional regulator n=1 Tax=Ammonicoccus fulvus TaxID=3138240 RepID=A0ABZ3FS83_9ACTN
MMARTTKPADERRDEILDAAQRLFVTKGFRATTIEDLLAAVGIAKGTLYYHFAGKDEILQALVMRTVRQVTARAEAVAASDLNPLHKFIGVVATVSADAEAAELAEEFHASGNDAFHLMSIIELICHLTPVLTRVVEEGVAAGVFTTGQPREDVEIILTGIGFLTDDGIFTGEQAEIPRRIRGLVDAGERLLGCPAGSLAVLAGSAAPETPSGGEA